MIDAKCLRVGMHWVGALVACDGSTAWSYGQSARDALLGIGRCWRSPRHTAATPGECTTTCRRRALWLQVFYALRWFDLGMSLSTEL